MDGIKLSDDYEIAQSQSEMSSAELRASKQEMSFERLTGIFDLLIAIFMLSQPALFAEYIYPLLTSDGILLAVYLLAWWRVGRALCLLMIPRSLSRIISPWLWLASAPLHSAALVYLRPQSAETITWHIFHLAISAMLWARRQT